ncbi:hypothetical protein BJX63DRAFT_435240 [Aspergillus granulosus]|uniref:Zn(2)-C6 fungal-type domain-containing protein n=1 Tax=Aspergillus granulosus TaxID=176169 RepID=A0ABR4H1Q3_9EURO
MPFASPQQSVGSKKCHKACERCRAMKVKCSGTDPCTRCARRKRRCHYTVEEERVSVPRSYLRDLEQRREQPTLHNNVTHQQFLLPDASPVLDVPEQHEPPWKFSHNPLIEYSFAKAPDGRFWYMGPSSSWSFCRRVLALLGEHVPETNHPPDPWNVDGTAFILKWRPLATEEVPDLRDLPPIDYGLYLIHTVHFHFDVLFYIIDKAAFIRSLEEFYTNPEEQVHSMRLWFAQYLLLIAFGKAFHAHNRPPNTPPDGYCYAARAMALMPDMSGMHKNPLQCIQALTLAAIYFQSVDMRVAAFQHIGYALRICIIEGIHRHVPAELNGEEFSRQCRTIFWIVYMLDREFAALIGAPSSIRDEDITVKLFVNGTVEEKALTLHVRLARLSARVLTTVYGVGADFDGTLIKDTQSIFRDLAGLSQDLNYLLKSHFHGSLSRASRAATRLILAYHHCVVLTTRPLVMCALHAHIERSQTPTHPHPNNNPPTLSLSLSPVVMCLLSCCVDSAQTVLQTLRTLSDQESIEAFLPFQIEDAFASAFLLYIIRVIAPTLTPEDHWIENTDFVMERLVAKGNLAAPLRRAELDHLKRVIEPLMIGSGSLGRTGCEREREHLGALLPSTGPELQGEEETQGHRNGIEELDWDIFGVEGTVGIEPVELLDLAEQLDIEGIMRYSVD